MSVDMSKAIRLLPRVGDRRMEVPTISDKVDGAPPQKCRVVEVNPRGLWYRVQFINTGFQECYKVPDLNRRNT